MTSRLGVAKEIIIYRKILICFAANVFHVTKSFNDTRHIMPCLQSFRKLLKHTVRHQSETN